MVDSKMLFITKVHQSVIASLSIRMNNALQAHPTSDNTFAGWLFDNQGPSQYRLSRC